MKISSRILLTVCITITLLHTNVRAMIEEPKYHPLLQALTPFNCAEIKRIIISTLDVNTKINGTSLLELVWNSYIQHKLANAPKLRLYKSFFEFKSTSDRNKLLSILAENGIDNAKQFEKRYLEYVESQKNINELFDLLIQKDADLDTLLSHGTYLVHQMVWHKEAELLEKLLTKAHVNIYDAYHNTPLHYAHQSKDLTLLLLFYGANPTLTDKHNRTAADLAKNDKTGNEIKKILNTVPNTTMIYGDAYTNIDNTRGLRQRHIAARALTQ